MPDELIVKQCAPTLAGIKTGSLFNCPYSTRMQLTEDIRNINRRLASKGLRVVPLRIQKGGALIYVFRPASLMEDLKDSVACDILADCGYEKCSTGTYISTLVSRLSSGKTGSDFPHEIGLFLGYPPEDVRGFIKNKATGHKISGCWKVYGDEKKALKTFAKFKKCTDVYTSRWADGVTIERLTVAG